MDFYTFMTSSASLSFSLSRCAEAGVRHQGSLKELLPVLRCIGLEGEQKMLAATKGINTQKGLIFVMGITLAAVGYLIKEKVLPTAVGIADIVTQIVEGIVEAELKGLNKNDKELTAGERLYRTHGITGIRGELEGGLPSIMKYGLPALRHALSEGLNTNDALLCCLMSLLTCLDDTTVMQRHSPEKMRTWVKNKAQELIYSKVLFSKQSHQAASVLDKEFVIHNVSPGGAADLLAVTWFIYQIEEQFTTS
jgi:holo-ACP synthase/triphosphoribosyl-dephospho-CoA synthase